MKLKLKIKNKIIPILSLLIVIGLISFVPGIGQSKEITHFKNDKPGAEQEITVKLQGEPGYSSDSTTYFSIPIHKGKIQEASLNVRCSANVTGAALLNPRLDIGIDGDYEWEFSGKGYGAIGHQTTFSTGINRKMLAIGNQRTNNMTKIYLPEDASVSSASLELKGGNLKYGEVYIAVVRSNTELWYIKSNGDRTFESPKKIDDEVGSGGGWKQSYGVGVGDFDNDGDNDIIVNEGSWSSSTVGNMYLYEKKGQGNDFKTETVAGQTAYYRNTGFAIGDFDNDKNLDFVESEWNQNFYFFKGYGNNSFTGTQIIKSFTGGTPYGKDSADFNLDGNLDFVTGCSSIGSVYVFEGKGDGTFKNPSQISSGTSRDPKCVIAGDYNLDGNPDILAKDYDWWNPSNFQFIEGKGDGTFREPIDTGIQLNNWDIRGDGFDFDFDGNQDLISYDNSGTVHIYWGRGNGRFNSQSLQISGIPGGITDIATPPAALLGGCDNLTVDIGEHGEIPGNLQFTGPITDKKYVSGEDFRAKLDDLVSNPPSHLRRITDDYGNKLIEIPIRFNASEIGNILLQNLSIQYVYEAKVDINPHNVNLVNELNDLIPKTGTGDFKVYFSIAADTPGEITFSDLSVIFNEAPTTKAIPDMEINEGTDNLGLIELHRYFNDDNELPQQLTYSVYSYTNKNYILASIYNNYWLRIDATTAPDWFGETSIIVAAEDSGNGVTHSNAFTVTINPVNDPPRVGVKLENINMMTNTVPEGIDLDDPNRYYFYDVDNSEMYFRAIIYDEEESGDFDGYLKLSIDNETNVLEIHSFERFKKEIPVRIYCSDSETVRTMPVSDLINIPTYQQILVNITSPGMGKQELFPPVWMEIEDIQLNEDTRKLNWLNLNNYTVDEDDSYKSLTYTVESVENSAFLDVYITTSKDKSENLLSIVPAPNYDGSGLVTLRVEDDEHNYAFEHFRITMIPIQDIPTIDILSPTNNSIISGKVIITGSANDPEDALEKVEIKIGDSPWQTVDGQLTYWTYQWDSIEYTTAGGNLLIKARAMDSENSYSIFDSVYLQIDNLIIDTDNDNVPDVYDACPNDPINWLDSDGDGVGDNTDQFPNDYTQWADSDGDGYGDNPSGNDYDMFPYDPTQWQDSDGDGVGDNLDGNNPDLYPNDPKLTGAEGDDDEGTGFSEYILWLLIIPFIFLDVLVFIYYISKRRKMIKENKNKDE